MLIGNLIDDLKQIKKTQYYKLSPKILHFCGTATDEIRLMNERFHYKPYGADLEPFVLIS